ncbi:MAG: hypothetical protein JST73_09660 [Actinobacteria bacterium]|nr:hypothetical protein [Actinomycetota bacterium]
MNASRAGRPPDEPSPLSPSSAPRTGVWWQRDRTAVAVICVLAAMLWWVRLHGPAWSMEEAMMLQAPARVNHGAIPGRDFDWFYGPLSLLVPAGVYRVGGATLAVERAVGAAYVAGVGVALYFVGRRWSFAIGVAMGVIAVSIGAVSMTALPIMGAVAAFVAMVAFAVSDLSPTRAAWAVGLSGALAIGLRPDFAIFVVVLLVVLMGVRAVRPVAWVACAVGLVPYLWPVIGAGLGATWRNLVTDATSVASERHLGWHPGLAGTGILALAGIAVSVGAVILGITGARGPRRVALIGSGVIGLCLVPEYFQRADPVHVVYVTMVPLAVSVPVFHELVGRTGLWRDRPGRREALAIALAVVLVAGIRPKFVARATVRDLRSRITDTATYPVATRGAVWYFRDTADASAHRRIVDAAARIARPGDVLFVGPADLDRPSYTDGSFYTLLPRYAQTTHFYDFHPRIARTEGGRLADDVRTADVLILCNVGFDEDNASSRRGSQQASRVVAEVFRRIDRAGKCSLYVRREPRVAR